MVQTPPNSSPSFFKKFPNKVIELLALPLLYSPSFFKLPNRPLEKEPVTTLPDSQTKQQPEPQYGEWMLVMKKKQGVKNGQGHAARLSNQQTKVETSGAKGDLGNPFNSLTSMSVGKAFLFKASVPQKTMSCEGNLNHTPKGQREALGNGTCDRSNRSA